MNELDFSELESVSGGIQLGGLAAVQQQTAMPLGVDPFTQQFGVPNFGVGLPIVPYGYGFALDNGGGCHGSGHGGGYGPGLGGGYGPGFGQLGVGPYGYGIPGGQLGVGPVGFFPGGQVAAGSQPIVAGGTLSVGPAGSVRF